MFGPFNLSVHVVYGPYIYHLSLKDLRGYTGIYYFLPHG